MTISIPETNDQSTTNSVKKKPSWEFITYRFSHFIAFGGGLGLSPFAPGTVGTLLAFPMYWFFSYYLEPIIFLLLIDLLFILGIFVCGVTGKALGSHDHGGMIWDETVAFLLILFFIPDDWVWQLAAFGLFRFFDIVKPQPIKYYDNKLRGGFGVMFDDLIAAFYTLLCLAIFKAFVLGDLYI